jgi:hypothetical protein
MTRIGRVAVACALHMDGQKGTGENRQACARRQICSAHAFIRAYFVPGLAQIGSGLPCPPDRSGISFEKVSQMQPTSTVHLFLKKYTRV